MEQYKEVHINSLNKEENNESSQELINEAVNLLVKSK